MTANQLHYAKMDNVYLAQVYLRLQELIQQSYPDPKTEDLTQLDQQYQEVESRWKKLDTEIDQLKERVKAAMQVQSLKETSCFKLSSYVPSPKVNFDQLMSLVQSEGIELDFPLTLTKEIQKQLGKLINHPSLQVEEIPSWRLTTKGSRRSSEPKNQSQFEPETEDLAVLDERYQEIQPQWKLLDSEINHLKERVKTAMQMQNMAETSYFKLASSSSTLKASFAQLSKLAHSIGIELDFPVTLTKEIQKELGEAFDQLNLSAEQNISWRLNSKSLTADDEEAQF